MHLTPSAVSSPGKVLLAGGYLVLDKAYSGLVFALSSRIHVTSAPLKDHPEGTISVVSPQFKNAHWAYQISKNIDGAGVIVAQVEHEGYVFFNLSPPPSEILLQELNGSWDSLDRLRIPLWKPRFDTASITYQ